MKVLLVEDNRADARLFAELLADIPGHAFRLTTAETFAAALPLVNGHDVVFLDLSLPDAHGIETVTRMVQHARGLPIVVLTGNDDDRVAVEAMKLGAQDYLLKSEITPSLIARSARYAVERKAAEQQAKRAHQADEAARRARFISSLMSAINASLDLQQTLPAVAKLMVPMLGDLCTLHLVRDGGVIERVAFSSVDPASEALLLARLPSTSTTSLPARVIAASSQILIERVDDSDLFTDPAHRELQHALGLRTILCVPLEARDRIVGALTCAIAQSEREFDSELQQLAQEVAERIALGIDNASLYSAAQRAIQGRDELLAVVSHDLRNPLNIVALALQAVASDAGAIANALPRALRGVDRMQRLIEDLLDVARIDTGTLAVDLRPLDLTSLVEETLDQHKGLAAEKRLTLARDLGATRLGIRGDRHRLGQVLANLLSNAFKFTPAGGTVKLGLQMRGEQVVLCVADSGPGIPPEHLAHIFDRFWQPQRRRDGVGLGLAIVKGIVDAHGGSIEVDSKPGEGTTFRVLMRRADLRPSVAMMPVVA